MDNNFIFNQEGIILDESSLPIDKEGSIIIKMRQKNDFMEKYNNSHRLLKIYDKTHNIEGMKSELCKLWYMYLVIEKYFIQKDIKDNNAKKEAIKAKAFILNDFQKYLKEVIKLEPDFDFSLYFAETEYNKDALKITTENVKGIKKLITALIGM